MVQLLAPYRNGMRLGQGFNSCSQQICLDNALLLGDKANRSRVRECYIADTGTKGYKDTKAFLPDIEVATPTGGTFEDAPMISTDQINIAWSTYRLRPVGGGM